MKEQHMVIPKDESVLVNILNQIQNFQDNDKINKNIINKIKKLLLQDQNDNNPSNP